LASAFFFLSCSIGISALSSTSSLSLMSRMIFGGIG
jgi:hypothetical protein